MILTTTSNQLPANVWSPQAIFLTDTIGKYSDTGFIQLKLIVNENNLSNFSWNATYSYVEMDENSICFYLTNPNNETTKYYLQFTFKSANVSGSHADGEGTPSSDVQQFHSYEEEDEEGNTSQAFLVQDCKMMVQQEQDEAGEDSSYYEEGYIMINGLELFCVIDRAKYSNYILNNADEDTGKVTLTLLPYTCSFLTPVNKSLTSVKALEIDVNDIDSIEGLASLAYDDIVNIYDNEANTIGVNKVVDVYIGTDITTIKNNKYLDAYYDNSVTSFNYTELAVSKQGNYLDLGINYTKPTITSTTNIILANAIDAIRYINGKELESSTLTIQVI